MKTWLVRMILSMKIMNSARKFYIRIFVVLMILGLSIFFGYHLFAYLRGPYISSSNKEKYSYQKEYVLNLDLETKYTQKAWINNLPADITDEGKLTGQIALHPGKNNIYILLEDRFGKQSTEIFTVSTPLEEINIPSYNEAINQENNPKDLENIESTEDETSETLDGRETITQ